MNQGDYATLEEQRLEEGLIDPISYNVFHDPVRASDGHVYERAVRKRRARVAMARTRYAMRSCFCFAPCCMLSHARARAPRVRMRR